MKERKAISEESGEHKAWMVEAKKQTVESLPEFIRKLTEDYEHDYGTICHAIAAAAIGAATAVDRAPTGGITGFQAGCVMWEIISGWGIFGEGPKCMLSYRDMLYPQYKDKYTTITEDTALWLKEEAQKWLIKDSKGAHEEVREHMQKVAEGWIPFGYRVRG